MGNQDEILEKPTVRKAKLFTSEGNIARCLICERKCSIANTEVGFCKTRLNINGQIFTLTYGDISSSSVNPIEMKPFFHFWPGSQAITIGSWSCNFPCEWCQNFEISKIPPDPITARYTDPKELVDSNLSFQGTSISFNEPTLLFEYALELFRIAKERKLYNTYVSNGYMTLNVLRILRDAGLDAIRFDIKGDATAVRKFCQADLEIVLRNIREARRLGMHTEVVVLLIPRVNDSTESIKEIISGHIRYAGAETPIHFTKFRPYFKMSKNKSTPIETLEYAHNLAKKEGIDYVYLGNCPGHEFENTYCKRCGKLLIQGNAFSIIKIKLTKDYTCPYCGQEIPIKGKFQKKILIPDE
jgi:pyruvate formate lyase activating enzyme